MVSVLASGDGDPGTSDDIAGRIQTFLATELGLGAGVEIDGLARVTTGRSRQNWLFEAAWTTPQGRRSEELIIRIDPEGGLIETDRSVEFAVLQALESTPVPAPRVRWLDADGSRFGRPSLVMVREHGDCDYYILGDEDRPVDARADLARRLCELLVEVHRVDWHQVGLDRVFDDPGSGAATTALDQWEAILDRDQLEPHPELDLAARWLRINAPPSPRTVLVHSDFKVGNVLLDPNDQIVALLDWELAHLGDPNEDLGWVTQPLRTREHYVPGAWERDELLAHYETASGNTVDREAVHWWNVMSCYKTAVMQVSGLRSFVEGRSDELYLPTAAVLGTLLQLVDS
jgi:aminoglycoside phosphotransferase (APT) family kinase protein